MAFGMCLLGATQVDLARIFGVVELTVKNWEKHIPTFHAACERGRAPADAQVMASLYRRTQPYEVTTKKIVWTKGEPKEVSETTHVPADPRAMELWLRLRKPWMGKLAEIPSGPPPPPGDDGEGDPADIIMGRLEGIRGRIIEHQKTDEGVQAVRSQPDGDEPEDDRDDAIDHES